jgi:hypothetical protein
MENTIFFTTMDINDRNVVVFFFPIPENEQQFHLNRFHFKGNLKSSQTTTDSCQSLENDNNELEEASEHLKRAYECKSAL